MCAYYILIMFHCVFCIPIVNGSFGKNYNDKCQIIIQSTLYRKHIPAYLLVTWNVTSQLRTYCITILPTSSDETYTL